MDLLERFLKYVSFPTNSDENSEACPSTEKQLVLADYLVKELKEIGLQNVEQRDSGYVYADIPANCEMSAPVIGFIAHMDTSEAAPDSPIRPRLVNYAGGDILLNEEKNIVMETSAYPRLSGYAGHRLIVTDGTTLLGADDKAGLAEIVTMAERLLSSEKPHGEVRLAFTPDEETGRGTERFSMKRFGADYAYTVDGGGLGEMEYECFNAASATVTVTGLSVHPGSAKNIMKNAALLACRFNSMLPEREIPSETEGYEGFYHLTDMKGETEHAELRYIIRDHDLDHFNERKQRMLKIAEEMNLKYGAGTVSVALKDSYFNMRKEIEKNFYVVERALQAMEELQITPVVVPIRGGTDGAMLTLQGLPCPNLCTGGENYHSRFEYASLDNMEKCVELLLQIVTDAVK